MTEVNADDSTPSRLVGIGIPVYNGEKWLEFTVNSMSEQTFEDLDILIVDNASSDRTPDICARLAAADSRVRYIRNQSNIGVFRNYDRTFHLTRGTYFKWCAVGDAAHRTFVEKAVEVLEVSSDVALVHAKTGSIGVAAYDPAQFAADLNLVDDDPTIRFLQYLRRVRLNNVMSGVIRRSELEKTCLNKNFHASDKCMIAELALRGKFVELAETLLYRRMEAATATALQSEEERRKFFSVEPTSPSVLWHWKTELTLLKGLLRSPLSVAQKASVLDDLGKRLLWQRRELLDDLLRYFRLR